MAGAAEGEQLTLLYACPGADDDVLSGERSITQLNHGAGLGLGMIHWIVTRSGGSIGFETADTGGNAVTVSLPHAGSEN